MYNDGSEDNSTQPGNNNAHSKTEYANLTCAEECVDELIDCYDFILALFHDECENWYSSLQKENQQKRIEFLTTFCNILRTYEGFKKFIDILLKYHNSEMGWSETSKDLKIFFVEYQSFFYEISRNLDPIVRESRHWRDFEKLKILQANALARRLLGMSRFIISIHTRNQELSKWLSDKPAEKISSIQSRLEIIRNQFAYLENWLEVPYVMVFFEYRECRGVRKKWELKLQDALLNNPDAFEFFLNYIGMMNEDVKSWILSQVEGRVDAKVLAIQLIDIKNLLMASRDNQLMLSWITFLENSDHEQDRLFGKKLKEVSWALNRLFQSAIDVRTTHRDDPFACFVKLFLKYTKKAWPCALEASLVEFLMLNFEVAEFLDEHSGFLVEANDKLQVFQIGKSSKAQSVGHWPFAKILARESIQNKPADDVTEQPAGEKQIDERLTV